MEEMMKYKHNLLLFLLGILVVGTINAQEPEWIWQHPSPQSNGLFGIPDFDEDNAIAVSQTVIILIGSDGGTQWEVLPSAANVEADLLGVHFVNYNDGWAVGDNAITLKTTNGGEDWDFSCIGT